MSRTNYRCGHSHRLPESNFRAEQDDIVKWKYSVGGAGTRELCYDCWKRKQKSITI